MFGLDCVSRFGGALWGPMGIFAHIVFWGGLIALLVYLFGRRSKGIKNSGEALEVLRERYARGEIDTEEFQQRKAELSK